MDVQPTALPEVLLMRPKIWRDAQGIFYEVYRQDALREHGIVDPFVQGNRSSSSRGASVRAASPRAPVLMVLNPRDRFPEP